MAYIHMIEQEEATGLLARQYDAAMARAGKLFNVVKIQSQRPKALRASIALYTTVMFGESELSRAERELLAVVVSRVNDCHY